jgi:hypothetical protein
MTFNTRTIGIKTCGVFLIKKGFHFEIVRIENGWVSDYPHYKSSIPLEDYFIESWKRLL